MIEINGVEYIERPVTKKQVQSAQALATISAIAMIHGVRPVRSNKQNHNINIVKEFGLIQNKASNLSKSERDYVVREFNRQYKIK